METSSAVFCAGKSSLTTKSERHTEHSLWAPTNTRDALAEVIEDDLRFRLRTLFQRGGYPMITEPTSDLVGRTYRDLFMVAVGIASDSKSSLKESRKPSKVAFIPESLSDKV